MSAFLGPIHFWLYNKIKIQNDIIEDIISLSESNNLNIRSKVYELYGDGDLPPLDEVIDVTNIHGWLQEKVSVVENKLAYAVTALLKEDPQLIDDLKHIFYDKGSEASKLSNDSSIDDAFKVFNDTLLDGMPCDHANVLLSQEENEIIWRREICVHQKYWDANGGDINTYYLLRDEFIKGLLTDTDIIYQKDDDKISRIYRR